MLTTIKSIMVSYFADVWPIITIITIIACSLRIAYLIKNKGKYLSNEMLKCILDKNEVFNQKADGLSTGLGLYLTNSLLQINGGNLIHFIDSEDMNIFGFSIELNKKRKQNFYEVITKPLISSKK